MGNENPFQAFLPKQFERCLPMEVLIPGAELVAKPVAVNPARSRTTDTLGSEISYGLASA
jgi:hypothetical protein